MYHNLTAVLAHSREQEIRSLAHQPDRLMARELELASRRTSRWRSLRRAR